jgi:CheY-like chemotaxis protein
MKVLVVDDDASTRLILRRLLSHLHCDVRLAVNGVEALAAIEQFSPDLVLLDVVMPSLDGVETLQAIRNSTHHADLPVISISSVSERAAVLKLVNLGIADYILKPLNVEETQDRLKRVLKEVRRANGARRQREVVVRAGRAAMLLVDGDPHFRAFARQLLEGRFAIVEAATGAEAIEEFKRHPADIVCIADRLQLLTPRILAASLRAAPRARPTEPLSVYLLSEAGGTPEVDHSLFDGVIRKSFVPDVFLRQFQGTEAAARSALGRIEELVEGELRAELVSAMQQTIGVLTQHEAAVVGEGAALEGGEPVEAVVELILPAGAVGVSVWVRAAAADVEKLGTRILGTPVAFEAGAAEAFGEVASTLAGRMQASLDARGFKCDQRGAVVTRVAPDGEPEREGILFGVAGEERILVGLRAAAIPPALPVAPAPEASTPEPPAVTPGA